VGLETARLAPACAARPGKQRDAFVALEYVDLWHYLRVMRTPWTAKISPSGGVQLHLDSRHNAGLSAWLCVYFFYHLFDRFNRSEIERLRLATSVKEAELRAAQVADQPAFHLQFAQLAARVD